MRITPHSRLFILALVLICVTPAPISSAQGVYRELWTNLTTSVGNTLAGLVDSI